MSELTAERARELLDYDPETGNLTWKVARGPRANGALAGTLNTQGYWRICVDWRIYQAHRLAWLITTGSWPIEQLDHINGVRADNRLANLREASQSINSQNLRRPRADNKSGYLGVSWCSSRESFEARIQSEGKQLFLGYFSVAEEAHDAYLEAKRRIHAGSTL